MAIYREIDRTQNFSIYTNDKGSNNIIINSYNVTIEPGSTLCKVDSSSDIFVGSDSSNINITNCSNITVLNGISNINLSNCSNITIYGNDVNISNTIDIEILESNISYNNNIKYIDNEQYDENKVNNMGWDCVQTPFTDPYIIKPGFDVIYEPYMFKSYNVRKG